MAWQKMTADGHKDCLEKVKAFCTKTHKAGAYTANPANVGWASVRGASATVTSVPETWTIECVGAGGNREASLSVTGSVSGVMSNNAICGIPYSCDLLSFTLVAVDDHDLVIGDKFTFDVTNTGSDWDVLRWNTDYDAEGEYELVMQGKGSGTDEILVGFITRSDQDSPAEYWNLRCHAFTGYIPSFDAENQPGYRERFMGMSDKTFTFTVIQTAYHVLIQADFAPEFQRMCYIGWGDDQYVPPKVTYPMFLGGCVSSSSAQPDTTSDHFWTGTFASVLEFDFWQSALKMHPLNFSEFEKWGLQIDSREMQLYPVSPVSVPSSGVDFPNKVYGCLRGLYHTTKQTEEMGIINAGTIMITAEQVCILVQSGNHAFTLAAMELLGD